MNIWAHRGCSQCYPENTLLSFEKAAAIKGLCGIELDIQMTKDVTVTSVPPRRSGLPAFFAIVRRLRSIVSAIRRRLLSAEKLFSIFVLFLLID